MIPVVVPAPAVPAPALSSTALSPEVLAAGNIARIAFGEEPIEAPEPTPEPMPEPEPAELVESSEPAELGPEIEAPELSEPGKPIEITHSGDEMPAWAARLAQSQEALFGMLRSMGTQAPVAEPAPSQPQIPDDIAAIADQLDMSTPANRAFIMSLVSQRSMQSTFAELTAERTQSKARAARESILAEVEKERVSGYKYADPKAVLHAHLFEGLSVREAARQSHAENAVRFGLPTKPVSPVRLVQPPGVAAVMAPAGTPRQTRPPPPPDFANMTSDQIAAGAQKIAARYGR